MSEPLYRRLAAIWQKKVKRRLRHHRKAGLDGLTGIEYHEQQREAQLSCERNGAVASPFGMTLTPERIKELREMPYVEYLQTSEWQIRRKWKLKRARYHCERCGHRSLLDVHHKTYQNRGNEAESDLQVLCRTCHARVHNQDDPLKEQRIRKTKR